jgi:hypothetical protein
LDRDRNCKEDHLSLHLQDSYVPWKISLALEDFVHLDSVG